MPRKPGFICLPTACVAALCGCATVNPRLDYERAARHVAEATGQDALYRPGDEEIVAREVEHLLAGGLTVDQAVKVSLLNNRRLQAAFMNVGMARADVVQSGLLSNPSLGVTLRLPAGGGLANLEAGLAQNIADLWQIPARKRASERVLDGAILDLARQAAELAAQAKGAYYRAVAAREQHKLAQENLSIAGNLLELTETRQQAGAGTELDVNLSRTVVVDAELAVESARLEAADAHRELATLLGVSTQASEIVLLSPLPDVPPEIPDAERLVEVARRARLDIQAARQAVLAAWARWEEQKRLVFPTLELGVAFERGERQRQGGRDLLADTARASVAGGGLTAPDIQPRSKRGAGMDFIIGPSLSMELPVFDQNQAQIARARYAVEQAVRTLDALDREVTQEIRGAVDRSVTAWRLVKVYRERSLPLAASSLDLSREAYKAGRASFLSVLEAQRFFLDSRSRYLEAAENAAIAIPELERSVGLPFPELIKNARAVAESVKSEGVEP